MKAQAILYSRYRSATVPLMAVIVRFVFASHCFLCNYRVVVAKDDMSYWALLLTLLPLAIETYLVLYTNGGEEWAR